MYNPSVTRESPTVKPPVTIRRTQTARIAQLFERAGKTTYFARLGGTRKSTPAKAREDYDKSLTDGRPAKIIDNKNGTFTVDLDWCWYEIKIEVV